MEKFIVAEAGLYRFYAKSVVLSDLALMMVNNLEISGNGYPVNIFVGVHQWIDERLPLECINIGIQTEQFADASGRKLWGRTSPFLPLIYLSKFDVVIDLNIPDARAYPSWAFWGHSVFGPYLFSGRRVDPVYGVEDFLLFIGTPNVRRDAQIQKFSSFYRIHSLSRCSWRDADEHIRKCSALLNVHYSKGLYTEWPRFLMAYLSGKILVSEELDLPLKSGIHYLPIGSVIDHALTEEIFRNIERDIAQRYRFDVLLSSLSRKKPHRRLRPVVAAIAIWLHFKRASVRKSIRCMKKRLRRMPC